jgi:hypothetical protein
MPNGMLYSLNPKDDNSELVPLHKDSIVFESLEELFEKFPKAVTWSYLNEL